MFFTVLIVQIKQRYRVYRAYLTDETYKNVGESNDYIFDFIIQYIKSNLINLVDT
nr:hypothetical protein CJLB15_00117 [Campylobacter phage CJLB-15]